MVNGTANHGNNLMSFDQHFIDQQYYFSYYYDVNVNNYDVKCGTSLRFWENNRWINSIDPYGWFQWFFLYWLDRRSLDDKRQINRWKRIVSIFKGKLIKMIKDVKCRFDDYSFSHKSREFFLHWGYELVESDLFSFFFQTKMSYYWFNKQELLQKANDRY